MITRINVKNNKSEKLAGILLKNKSKELIIICHGYKISKDFRAIKIIADGLYEEGYCVFRFDFTGHGQSEGNSAIDLMQQVDDIGSVVKNFQDQYGSIILIGCSLAGLITAIAARKYPNIDKFVTINGVFDLDNLGLRSFSFRLFKRKQHDYFKENFLPESINTPALVIHSRDDKVVDISQSKKFYDKLHTEKRFAELKEADHHLSKEKNCTLVVDIIAKWLG
ncbi:alpha/beta fold hydrolase [Candidatus Woesearchaeota archaeon]|nr:alpha/beta fold hydrolase [Candidatus Woesearchaeota archaeon]